MNNENKGKTVMVDGKTATWSDKLCSAIFKIAFAYERNQEMTSGMMYRTTEEKLLKALNTLLDCEIAHKLLSDEDRKAIVAHIQQISCQIFAFNNAQCRYRYDTSYPCSGISGFYDNQIFHFGPPNTLSPTPTVSIFLIADGYIGFKMSYDQAVLKRLGITNKPEGVYESALGYLKPLESSILQRLRAVLKSSEFVQRWNELDGRLTYTPKTKIEDIVNLESL